MERALRQRVAALAQCLSGRAEMLASAESCTGGLVAAACTELAGSSAWFERGFVTYSNAAKQELLGVPEATLARYGAVSAQTVVAMVEGALAKSRADWALAVSGIAGPGGGSAEKPVGTVWFAWGGPAGWRCTERQRFAGDRAAVRAQSVLWALERLYQRASGGE